MHPADLLVMLFGDPRASYEHHMAQCSYMAANNLMSSVRSMHAIVETLDHVEDSSDDPNLLTLSELYNRDMVLESAQLTTLAMESWNKALMEGTTSEASEEAQEALRESQESLEGLKEKLHELRQRGKGDS